MVARLFFTALGLGVLLLQPAGASPLAPIMAAGKPGDAQRYIVLAQAKPTARVSVPRVTAPRIVPPRVIVPIKPVTPNIAGRLTNKKKKRTDETTPEIVEQTPPEQTPVPPKRAPVNVPPIQTASPEPAPLPSFRPFIAADLPDFRPNEVIARFAPGTAPNVPGDVAAALNLQILRQTQLSLINALIVVYSIPPDGRTVADVVAQIGVDGRATAEQTNNYFILSGDSGGSGGMVSSQYSLAALNVEPVQHETRGKGVRVAIIDSGIDVNHLELQGAIQESYDAAGYGISDPDKHGTSIAGIVGARGQLRGIAPEVSLLAVRAFWQNKRDEPLSSSSEVIARAIDWAVSEGNAQVLNLSFAGPSDDLIAEVIKAATERGVIAVSAAGNAGPDAPPAYPAALPEVIAVTATDNRDALFVAANRGDYVDVAAPGVDILSPAPGNGYQVITGTSMATANISGLIALLVEGNRGELLPEVAAELLEETAKDLGPQGRDPEFGYGRADAARALAKLNPLRAAVQ